MNNIRNNKDDIYSNEEVANMIFATITDEQFERVDELCGEHFDILYSCWLEEHGFEFADKWTEEHGTHISGYDDIVKATRALMDHFIAYLES